MPRPPPHSRIAGFTLPSQAPYNFLMDASLISPHGSGRGLATPLPDHNHGAENIVSITRQQSPRTCTSGQEIV